MSTLLKTTCSLSLAFMHFNIVVSVSHCAANYVRLCVILGIVRATCTYWNIEIIMLRVVVVRSMSEKFACDGQVEQGTAMQLHLNF